MGVHKTRLLQALERLAPVRIAESWDNVGLLLDVEKPGKNDQPYKVLITIDLTPKVLDEAVDREADFIIAYHPTWFSPIKRLTSDTNNTDISILHRCCQNGIPLYSPHTCLDAIPNGSEFSTCSFIHTYLASPPPKSPVDSSHFNSFIVFKH